jgi:hypothetical protein
MPHWVITVAVLTAAAGFMVGGWLIPDPRCPECGHHLHQRPCARCHCDWQPDEAYQ